jgi:proteasome assembly chaperone (PAC2) family protein
MNEGAIAIIAFEGWNDAGEAATAAIDHLIEEFDAQVIYSIDPEPYYDFQINRPFLKFTDEGNRIIEWRTTHIFQSTTANSEKILLVRGIEPSMHWKQFTTEFLKQLTLHDVSLVIALGALLADTAHTRPIPVTPVTMSNSVAEKFEIEISDYEGPTGILGVIQQALSTNDKSGISLWAAVPHYVSQPPCPKATMALLDALSDVIELDIDLGEFPERAEIWQSQVDSLVQNDDEMVEYVRKLEAEGDASQLSIASGETIAKEFERYLRRRNIK